MPGACPAKTWLKLIFLLPNTCGHSGSPRWFCRGRFIRDASSLLQDGETERLPTIGSHRGKLSAQTRTLPAEISQFSDFQWLEHQFTTRVFASNICIGYCLLCGCYE